MRQGEVIAYVGDTGNAGAGNYHLHFSIAAVSDPKRYWEGTNINPYPLLHDDTDTFARPVRSQIVQKTRVNSRSSLERPLLDYWPNTIYARSSK